MGIFHKKSQLEKKYKVDPPVLGTGNFAQVKKCMRLEDKKEFAGGFDDDAEKKIRRAQRTRLMGDKNGASSMI